MVELADAADSKSAEGNLVGVRPPLPAPLASVNNRERLWRDRRLGVEECGGPGFSVAVEAEAVVEAVGAVDPEFYGPGLKGVAAPEGGPGDLAFCVLRFERGNL